MIESIRQLWFRALLWKVDPMLALAVAGLFAIIAFRVFG